MKVIPIPTLNDDLRDFDRLFQLWRQMNKEGSSYRLDFSRCVFLRQNAVAFLGGLIRMVEFRGGEVEIDWGSFEIDVFNNLAKNQFLYHFGEPSIFENIAVTSTGNTIPFREDEEPLKEELIEYLKIFWLGRGWVHISKNLRDLIVGKVLEIFVNSFEHSQSNIGVFSCGQHFPRLNQLILTVVDFGVGIPTNVRGFLNKPTFEAKKAIEWAFESGNSTKSNDQIGRGLGLDLLKDFVVKNQGCMEVFSHDGYARITSERETYVQRSAFFEGTLISIKLQCDEKYYMLTSETNPEFQF